MPTISRFYGVIIRMFFEKHAPLIFTHNMVNLKHQLTFRHLKSFTLKKITMYYDVIEAKIIGELSFSVRFVDGLEGNVHFQPSYLYGVFEKLKNPTYFNQIKVIDGFVSWGEDDIDLAPDSMYQAISQQGKWILS